MSDTPKLPTEVLNDVTAFFKHDGRTPISAIQLDHSLYSASRCVAEASGIAFSSLSIAKKLTLEEIAQMEQFEFRSVALNRHWWKYDNGPLLVFKKDSQSPCALLPEGDGYSLVDPNELKPQLITAETDLNLADQAYFFYRQFNDEKLTLLSLFYFSLKGIKSDLMRVIGLQFIIGLLSLVIPVATSSLFSQTIPNADYSRLWQWCYALFVISLGITLFDLSQFIGELRIRFKLNVSLQSALWDRLLHLPIQFFREFDAGDLSTRADVIDSMQQTITGAIFNGIMSAIFSIIPLCLMFYYNVTLGLTAAGLSLLFVIIYFIGLRFELFYRRKMLRIQGALASWELQLLSSIHKLRTANAEERAYFMWVKDFIDSLKVSFKAGYLSILLNTFNVGFAVIVMIIIYFLVIVQKTNITFGQFIGFNAAYGIFSAALFSSAGSIGKMVYAFALYERATPILNTVPERYQHGIDPGKLNGKIEFENVSFHYSEDIKTLNNIQFIANPGQFIAIVGPSGAGKSTLMQLLIGFEKPSKGKILFDDHDLATLAIQRIRQQMGVVLQNDVLLPGTIYQNICCSAHLSLDQAWELARLVGIDDEIKAMPMGMHTFVMEGGKSFSSGQRQRIMIARALANQPRILLLDEATSSLDNTTQALVHRNLKNQHITRIVVAQRLSTIRDADYIYVLQDGNIVQQGTYNELITVPGLFQVLARQQTL